MKPVLEWKLKTKVDGISQEGSRENWNTIKDSWKQVCVAVVDLNNC